MELKFQNPSFNPMQNNILEQVKVDQESDKFGSQLNRKSKIWFFTFLNVYVSWIERGKFLISQFTPPKFRYFADQNRRKEDLMKINFDNNFQMQKWISQTELKK